MKKRIFAAVIATFVMVMAFSVSAFALSVSGPATVETGQVVTLTIDGGSVEGVTGDITTSGLELISFSGGLSDETSILLLADLGGMTGTYTYRVTATAGQTASFTVSNVMEAVNDVDTPAPGASWRATVTAGSDASQTPTPTEQPTEQPSTPASEQPSTSASAQPTGGGQTPQDTQTPGQQTNPPQDQQTPAPSGSTPPAGGNAGTTTTGGGTTGGTTGGTAGGTTTGHLPKTADSTTNMWLFACLTAAVGTIAIIAAKKCSIRGEARDEQ